MRPLLAVVGLPASSEGCICACCSCSADIALANALRASLEPEAAEAVRGVVGEIGQLGVKTLTFSATCDSDTHGAAPMRAASGERDGAR